MPLTRRSLLSAASFGVASTLLPPLRRSLRVVLLTDIHLPANGRNDLVRRCLDQVVKEKPDLILFGGDQVMNVDGGDRISEAEADAQFANFRSTVLDRLKGIPTAAVIGNHCIWRNTKDKALAAYGMPARYYRREMGGWRILMLDTFHGDRTCRVDAEQMEWLKRELAETKLPILVLSHAPILTVTSFIEDEVPKAGKFEIPDRWQTANLQALRELFYEHPNVRLAISGHMHQIDRCDFDRVSYVCGGAVCGNWWGGAFHRFPPAYLVFDLDRNGAFRHRTVFWDASSRA